MILKYKGSFGKTWCYEDLGNDFFVHIGGVEVSERANKCIEEHSLELETDLGLEEQIQKYLNEKLGLTNYRQNIIRGTNSNYATGSYGFTLICYKDTATVLLGQEAYILSDSGKTVERL